MVFSIPRSFGSLLLIPLSSVMGWVDADAGVAVLPITLDTATNRAGMPDADFDSWTPLDTVAARMVAWAKNEDRPANGALVKLVTKNKVTTFEAAE